MHLACLADEPVTPTHREVLESLCARVAIAPVGGWRRLGRIGLSLARGRTASEGAFWVPELAATLERWATETPFQTVLASASCLVPYLRSGALRNVPAVIDLVDVDSQKWLDYAEASRGPKAWLYRTEGRRLRRLEAGLSEWARAVTLVSSDEADLYRRSGGTGLVAGIVNGVDLDYFQPDPVAVEGPCCAFVGALDYRPNVEGIAWFCRTVWPGVRRSRPDATLQLVGRRPCAEVRALAEAPGVELIGAVPDVRPHVARSAVAIAPLRIARGVQNKVLEALAMGKAAVISPGASTGLDLKPDIHVRVASAVEQWVEAIVGLLGDPVERRRLGAAGRRFVEQHHDWDRCLEPFGPLLGLKAELPPSPAGSARRASCPLTLS